MDAAVNGRSYMLKVRNLVKQFSTINITELMPLFAIANLDKDWYPGLVGHYIADDSALTSGVFFPLAGPPLERLATR